MRDAEFDAAWTVFKDDDGKLQAPAQLQDAVMSRWDEASDSHQVHPVPRPHLARAALAAAATVTIAAALIWAHRESQSPLSSASVSGFESEVTTPRVHDVGAVAPRPFATRAIDHSIARPASRAPRRRLLVASGDRQ